MHQTRATLAARLPETEEALARARARLDALPVLLETDQLAVRRGGEGETADDVVAARRAREHEATRRPLVDEGARLHSQLTQMRVEFARRAARSARATRPRHPRPPAARAGHAAGQRLRAPPGAPAPRGRPHGPALAAQHPVVPGGSSPPRRDPGAAGPGHGSRPGVVTARRAPPWGTATAPAARRAPETAPDPPGPAPHPPGVAMPTRRFWPGRRSGTARPPAPTPPSGPAGILERAALAPARGELRVRIPGGAPLRPGLRGRPRRAHALPEPGHPRHRGGTRACAHARRRPARGRRRGHRRRARPADRVLASGWLSRIDAQHADHRRHRPPGGRPELADAEAAHERDRRALAIARRDYDEARERLTEPVGGDDDHPSGHRDAGRHRPPRRSTCPRPIRRPGLLPRPPSGRRPARRRPTPRPTLRRPPRPWRPDDRRPCRQGHRSGR